MALSADVSSKHGQMPHGIVFDELHTQPNRRLFDVLRTGMGKRAQPMMVMITTAGTTFTRSAMSSTTMRGRCGMG